MSANADSTRVCPTCSARVSWGRCSTCGWRSAKRVAREAGERTGKNGPQVIREKRPRGLPHRPYIDPPIVMRDVHSESGELLLREYRCPECSGKGWLKQALFTSCSGCFGRGVISPLRYTTLLNRHQHRHHALIEHA